MITAPATAIRERCLSVARNLRGAIVQPEVVNTIASVGAGAFPTHEIPSFGLALAGNAPVIEEALRAAEPSVIGHITDDRMILDLRSVPPGHDAQLTSAVLRALG